MLLMLELDLPLAAASAALGRGLDALLVPEVGALLCLGG